MKRGIAKLQSEENYAVVNAFNIAIMDTDVTSAAISRRLGERGVKVPAGALRRHRKGECDCGKVTFE